MLKKFCDNCGTETLGASLIRDEKVRTKPGGVLFEIKCGVEVVLTLGTRTPDAHACTDCVKEALKRAFAE